MQTHDEFNAGNLKRERKNIISKHSKLLDFPEDTTIPFIVLRKHHKAYEAHLQRISDFLLHKPWTENATGIQFFDKKDQGQTFPVLRHFRNTNLQQIYR